MALERLNPLRFADPADETAFFESFCLDKLRLNQGSIFLAGLILYAFFLWDQHLDPVHWQRGQAIRGLVLTPGLWLLAALMNLRAFRPRLEALVVFGLVFTSACLGWIAYVHREPPITAPPATSSFCSASSRSRRYGFPIMS